MITINRITNLDVIALQELRAASRQEGYRFIERLCEEWVSSTNRFNGPGEALFIAVARGKAIGICGLNRDPYANTARIGRVRRLYVLPEFRSNGIGRALLEAVVAHASGSFSVLRLRTETAGDFFSAQGFRPEVSDPDTTHVLDLPTAKSGD